MPNDFWQTKSAEKSSGHDELAEGEIISSEQSRERNARKIDGLYLDWRVH